MSGPHTKPGLPDEMKYRKASDVKDMSDTQDDLMPCPFCGKHDTTELVDSNTFRDLQPWETEAHGHPIYWAIMCDASKPNGKGGCGASGGFMPTEQQAISVWNTRAHFQRQAEPVATVLVGHMDHGPFDFHVTAHGMDTLKDGLSDLYTSPPIPADMVLAPIRLDEKAAADLRNFIGNDEPMAVTLSIGYVKDEDTDVLEYGLRATATEYPEEGSIMLVPMPPPAAPKEGA